MEDPNAPDCWHAAMEVLEKAGTVVAMKRSMASGWLWS